MRQVDSSDAQPLGPAKRKDPPTEKPPEWKPVPGKPGVEVDAQGRLRTNIPANNGASWPLPFPYYGTPGTWGAAIESIRRGK